MHKSTKLTSSVRRVIYEEWCRTGRSYRFLGRKWHVDKNVIRTVVTRGRMGDFTAHDSTNLRYRTVEYGLRRLSRTEDRVGRILERRIRRGIWTDRDEPGELVHFDSKALPRLRKDARIPTSIKPKEHLFVAIDDCTRWLYADILPERTGDAGAMFLELCAMRLPFPLQCHFSDNGSEFKGNMTHPVVSLCAQLGIRQKFTRPRHPWTNGKAERVIRTLLEEWLVNRQWQSYEERRKALYRYVDWYNHRRPHMALGGKTPAEKLLLCLGGGDNAC